MHFMSQVTMTGGEEYPANVVGFDADKDVAVLRLKLPDTVDRQAMAQPCAFQHCISLCALGSG